MKGEPSRSLVEEAGIPPQATSLPRSVDYCGVVRTTQFANGITCRVDSQGGHSASNWRDIDVSQDATDVS